MAVVALSPVGASPHPRIEPLREPEAWVKNNERITNEADVEAWLALYAEDAVFDAITEQYTFLDVRPSASATAMLRALFGGELSVKRALSAARRTERRASKRAAP